MSGPSTQSPLSAPNRVREMAGVVALLFGAILFLSLVSYHPYDPSWNVTGQGPAKNVLGQLGAHLSDLMFQFFGNNSYVIAAICLLFAFAMMLQRRLKLRPISIVGYVCIGLLSAALWHLFVGQSGPHGYSAGGVWGQWLAELLKAKAGLVGAYLFLLSGIVLAVIWTTQFSFGTMMSHSWRRMSPRMMAWWFRQQERFLDWRDGWGRWRKQKQREAPSYMRLSDQQLAVADGFASELPALELEGAWLDANSYSSEETDLFSATLGGLPELTPPEKEAILPEKDQFWGGLQRDSNSFWEDDGISEPGEQEGASTRVLGARKQVETEQEPASVPVIRRRSVSEEVPYELPSQRGVSPGSIALSCVPPSSEAPTLIFEKEVRNDTVEARCEQLPVGPEVPTQEVTMEVAEPAPVTSVEEPTFEVTATDATMPEPEVVTGFTEPTDPGTFVGPVAEAQPLAMTMEEPHQPVHQETQPEPVMPVDPELLEALPNSQYVEAMGFLDAMESVSNQTEPASTEVPTDETVMPSFATQAEDEYASLPSLTMDDLRAISTPEEEAILWETQPAPEASPAATNYEPIAGVEAAMAASFPTMEAEPVMDAPVTHRHATNRPSYSQKDVDVVANVVATATRRERPASVQPERPKRTISELQMEAVLVPPVEPVVEPVAAPVVAPVVEPVAQRVQESVVRDLEQFAEVPVSPSPSQPKSTLIPSISDAEDDDLAVAFEPVEASAVVSVPPVEEAPTQQKKQKHPKAASVAPVSDAGDFAAALRQEESDAVALAAFDELKDRRNGDKAESTKQVKAEPVIEAKSKPAEVVSEPVVEAKVVDAAPKEHISEAPSGLVGVATPDKHVLTEEDEDESVAVSDGKPLIKPRVKPKGPGAGEGKVTPKKARWQLEGYEPPPLDFLNYEEPAEDEELVPEHLHKNAEVLERTLENFGVRGKVTEIRPGPVITLYEYLPEPGIKVSKIAGLSDDLAMALHALQVRVIAPIPGKGVVGIELPNKRRENVYMREILADDSFQNTKMKLPLAMGKDTTGTPYIANLAKMPHLLIAGTTGSGKSVGVNSMICSMLYNSSPDEVRFLMVDPKMLELSIYDGIPHLLLPVVIDPQQAAKALNWAVSEMERRYQLMAEAGVRNINNYNHLIEKRRNARDRYRANEEAIDRMKREALSIPPDQVDWDDDDEEEFDMDAMQGGGSSAYFETFPYIVIIIDELADLMMVAAKEVEFSIARLAQMARAAGLHLMLATQRPSVDVLTGVIKANFPSRLAFQVKSKIDSRTILDQPGAEKLLGMGDMLLVPPGSSSPTRLHGAFISEEEIHKIVKHLKTQGSPDYNEEILKATAESEDADEDADPMYDQACEIVLKTRNASISHLQRKLRIGYNRAARIIEYMEKEQLIGPQIGNKPREVLVPPSV